MNARIQRSLSVANEVMRCTVPKAHLFRASPSGLKLSTHALKFNMYQNIFVDARIIIYKLGRLKVDEKQRHLLVVIC